VGARVKVTFEEIALKAVKRWKDPVTGKPRQQTRKFFQTVNPWNKTVDGVIKTPDMIRTQIKAERDAWLKEPPCDST
jgi:hypothetical protein